MLSSFLFLALDVECYRGEGKTYKGNVNVTREGLKCTAWNRGKVYADLGNQNHCRNPGTRDNPHAGVPWCFTAEKEPTIWGYCNIRKCHGSPSSQSSKQRGPRTTQTENKTTSKKYAQRGPRTITPKNSNGRDKGRDVPLVYSMVIAPLRKIRNKFMS